MRQESSRTDRRSFLARSAAGIAAGALAVPGLTAVADAAGAAPPPTAADAKSGLERLLAGNARFVAGHPICAPLTKRRAALAHGQSPYAIVLSCSDSRVPVETVFDEEPGNIFGVRIAGNFLDDNGIGSIEYSVAVLKSTLIVVMGHSECGAVKAAVENVNSGAMPPGHIAGLVRAIAPAAKESQGHAGNWLHNAIVQNVRENVAALPHRSAIVAEAVHGGKLRVVGALYDLASGKVTFL